MKVKKQKGLTLMALILTIVVLLIIATSAISTIKENHIIENANKNQVAIENSKFDEYNQKLNNYGGGPIGGSGSNGELGDDATVQIKVGSYVEYDISYIDIYTNSEYTSKTGWRYLGTDDDGNKLLISTAIPMILNYSTEMNDVIYQWWDTTQKNINDKMVEGLKKNFSDIPYSKVSFGTTSTSDKNTMIGLFGLSDEKVGNYFESRKYALKVKKVRTLTLAELNRAVNNVNGNNERADDDTSSGYKSLSGEANGLFNMKHLIGYNKESNVPSWSFWLASPYEDNSNGVYNVSSADDHIKYGVKQSAGVRPVIVLNYDVNLVYNSIDKIFKIRSAS